jgi:hypothetical protein
MKQSIAFAALTLLSACAGHVDFVGPSTARSTNNSIEISKSREAVWAATIPALGKQFFVINNLDQSSGLINVSYSGDPEKYIDCGTVSSYVKNARGERTYTFPGSQASTNYEMMVNGAFLIFINRTMSLDGRVNLIFESIGPSRTRVSANTRYVLKRDQTLRDVQGRSQTLNHSISLNSGQQVSFPAGNDGRALQCIPTGALEAELLDTIRAANN